MPNVHNITPKSDLEIPGEALIDWDLSKGSEDGASYSKLGDRGGERETIADISNDVDGEDFSGVAVSLRQDGKRLETQAEPADGFEGLVSASNVNHLESVFDAVSTVPSDYHSYTMNSE
ncbi:hypothetical protein CMUS01_04293 [Colletotrichum musicola]|uniref:Uncharacterized protein n=1 Tax=Colletotrichum musicola TaxID=2175873 RepID=A0A8H6KX46_9PEZI|nr:hypothetical protein CMUS01_04293 [Colletotrichum musicola]